VLVRPERILLETGGLSFFILDIFDEKFRGLGGPSSCSWSGLDVPLTLQPLVEPSGEPETLKQKLRQNKMLLAAALAAKLTSG
jgi:hypothetical protein